MALMLFGLFWMIFFVPSISPLATVIYGPVEVRGISDEDAINLFLGLVFFSMGVTVTIRSKRAI